MIWFVQSFSSETWVLIVLAAGAGVLGSLHSLAAYYRECTRVHDLKVRVANLRREYARRIAELNKVVEVGEEESPEDASVLKAEVKKAA